MRFPYPSNFTYADWPRFIMPALSFTPTWHGDAVEVPDGAPQADVDTLMAALAAYDRNTPTAEEIDAAEVLTRYRESILEGKTAPEAFLDVRARVDAISTLAEAKAFLRVAIPLLAAAVVADWRHRG